MSYSTNELFLFPDLDKNLANVDSAMALAIRSATNKYTNLVHPETYTTLENANPELAQYIKSDATYSGLKEIPYVPVSKSDTIPTFKPSSATASSSIFSYFTKENVVSEFKADIGELIIVFLTSAGISFYMGDKALIAIERGSIMSIGQYIGGFIADATSSMAILSNSNIGNLMTKFIISTSIYIGGNELLINPQIEIKQLFGESLVASIFAHYGGQMTKEQINNLSQNKYLSMYN